MIKVFSSSISTGKLEDISGRATSNFKTKNEMNPFIGIDLGINRGLRITAYTIRNGNSNANTMICWQFEGSNTGNEWAIIDRRVHSTSEDVKYLAEKGKSSTWGVINTERSYRYFRLVQTDRNLAGNFVLSISCIELYGIITGNGWDLI